MIGEALSDDASQRNIGTGPIIESVGDAVVIAELELTSIAMQVLLVAVLVDAAHTALEDREIAFNGIGVNVAPNILASAMHNEIVRCKIVVQLAILTSFVGVDGGFLGDVRAQDGDQGGLTQVFDNNGLGAASGAIHQRQNLVLVVAAAGSLGFFVLDADESLIHLNNAAIRAQPGRAIGAHRFADTVRHEPSGFQGDAKGPVQLVAANALFAGAHQVDRLQPDVHGNVAGLEKGADLYGEGLATLVALVRADPGGLATHLGHALALATLRASRSMWPNPRLNIGVSGFFVVKLGAGQDGHDVFFLACPLYIGVQSGYVKYNIAYF